MELIEIIKSTLSIFSAVSFVFIVVSYTIFKIKDRTRIKPYLRVNIQSPINNMIIEERIQEELQHANENWVKNNELISRAQKPQEAVVNQPARIPLQNRFKIINENKPLDKVTKPEPEVVKEKPQKIKVSKEKKNIYDLYSQTDEKMHKLKLAVN